MLRARALHFAGVYLALVVMTLISAASPLAQVGPAQVGPASQAGPVHGPMEITTDTPEYCRKLLDRMSSLVRLATAPIPHEATVLTTEGQKMCDHGQIRGGIMRVRSALMIMEKGNGPAYR